MNVTKQGKTATINIRLNDLDNYKCDCGCEVFNSVVVLKKLSALQSPSGKEELIPIPVFCCVKCSKVHGYRP